MALSKVTVGIDLGTSYSSVGVWQNGKVKIIPTDPGQRTTPSYISFTDQGRLVGHSALAQAVKNPKNTVWGFKALLGRTFDDPAVQEGMKNWPFQLVDVGGEPIVEVVVNGGTKRFTPEELTCRFLMYLKHTAEDYLGHGVTYAVITIPAGFNSFQVAATKRAAEMAGFNVIKLISDLNAAAISYLERMGPSGSQRKEKKNMIIVNVGGGTTGVSVLTLQAGSIKVKATHGNTNLGGEHLDNRLVEHLCRQFQLLFKKHTDNAPRAIQGLRMASKKAKWNLSAGANPVLVNDIFSQGVKCCITLTQALFENMCDNLFSRAGDQLLRQVLMDSGMAKSDIHEILLVGGSSRIPRIQKMLKDFFDGKELNLSLHLDEASVQGATIFGALLSGCKGPSIDHIMNLKDVTPFSFGVELAGGVMSTLIPRNSAIPTRQTKMFSTVYDNQPAVIIAVYEGEGFLAKDNILVGTFALSKIPPAPAGVPRIEVTFDIDANGSLVVIAVLKSTGQIRRFKVDPGNWEVPSRAEIAKKLALANEVNAKQMHAYQDDHAVMRGAHQTLRGLCGNAQDDKDYFDKKLKGLEMKKKLDEDMLTPQDFPITIAATIEDIGNGKNGGQDGASTTKKRRTL